MLLDRARDGFILTLSLRVVFAHQALHFREFADHFGEQVGLGEARGAPAFFDVGASTSGASSAASRSMRSMRSAWVPSFSWNTICLNFGSRSSSFTLRSVS